MTDGRSRSKRHLQLFDNCTLPGHLGLLSNDSVIITVHWHHGHLSLRGSALICISTCSLCPPEGTPHPPHTQAWNEPASPATLQPPWLPLYNSNDRMRRRKRIMDSCLWSNGRHGSVTPFHISSTQVNTEVRSVWDSERRLCLRESCQLQLWLASGERVGPCEWQVTGLSSGRPRLRGARNSS